MSRSDLAFYTVWGIGCVWAAGWLYSFYYDIYHWLKTGSWTAISAINTLIDLDVLLDDKIDWLWLHNPDDWLGIHLLLSNVPLSIILFLLLLLFAGIISPVLERLD